MDSNDPTPCFEKPNGACRAEHMLGDFGVINHDLTTVTLAREFHGRDGIHTTVAIEFSEAGEDIALSLPLAQAHKLAVLLCGAVDLYELHRTADTILQLSQVTA